MELLNRVTRTSPAGHGGTEGIGMGTVFCNVLTKPNNFLKIEILNLFFRKKKDFLKNLKFFQKNLRIPQNAQKHQKTMFWGSFKKIFFRSFFDFWVSVRQVRADFHLVEIICHIMTCIYFSESSKGSANAYGIKKIVCD